MNRKLVVFLFIVVAAALVGQSLQDNEFYLKMVELKQESEKAFGAGDYIEAKRIAEEAQSYKVKSDEWIATQLAAYRARSSLGMAKDKLASAVGRKSGFASEYGQANELYKKSSSEFHDDANYTQSLSSSKQAISILDAILNSSVLPAYYKVRLIRGNRDSLWKIAGYKFIYNDPWKWTVLYKANKKKMPIISNPDLIYPGTILKIPPLKNEKRSGTWVNGEIK